MSTNKDLQVLITKAVLQGWEVKRTGGGHLKWVSPSGTILFSGFSHSDSRSIKNLKSQLRVAGFIEIQVKTKRKDK